MACHVPAPLLIAVALAAALAVGCDAERAEKRPRSAKSSDLPGASRARRPAVERGAKSLSDRLRAAPGEWPNLHGPGGRNVATDRDLNWDWPESGPPVAWRVPCGTGYSCPVVAEGAVVLLHRVGPDVGPFAASAAALGGEEPTERLAWFDLNTGAPGPTADVPARFESEFPGHSGAPYATPAIGARGADGVRRVYAYGAAGTLRAVDFDTAEPLWTRDLAAETAPAQKPFATSSSPVLFDADDGRERVLIATGGTEPNTGLTCLDGATGEVVWQAIDARESYSTPLLFPAPGAADGRRFVAALMKTRLIVADPATGEEFGSLPFELRTVDAMNATSPAVSGDVLFVGSGPSGRTAGCMAARVGPDGSLTELLAQPPRTRPAVQLAGRGGRACVRVRFEPRTSSRSYGVWTCPTARCPGCGTTTCDAATSSPRTTRCWPSGSGADWRRWTSIRPSRR